MNTVYVGQIVRYLNGRIWYQVTAVNDNMVTMVRRDGKDNGNPTTTAKFNLSN